MATFPENNRTMDILKLFSRFAALVIVFSIAIPVQAADDIQDANKLFKQGQHAKAMEKVDAFLATKPKDAQARFLKGLILTEQGNTADAIKVFAGITEDYPELPEPYNNLAVLYAGQGQYEKAKSALEMAIRTNPNYSTAHENLGDIYAKMASQAYDRALQLDKSNASAKTKLALIRDLLGKNARTTAKPASTAVAETAPATAAPTVAAPVAASSVAASAASAATSPAPTIAADPAADVLKATNEWAAAWSAKDSEKFLAFYAKEFKMPDGENRSTWESQRKERIAKRQSILVQVRDAQVRLVDDKHASVSFKQTYRDSRMNTTSSKTLEWVKTDGQWLIAEEHLNK